MNKLCQNRIGIRIHFNIPAMVLLLFYGTANFLGAQECQEEHDLITRKWQLRMMNDHPVSTAIYSAGVPYIELKAKDHALSGFTGCNVIHGRYEISADQLKFDQIISTKKYCEGIPETEFLESLSNIEKYKIEGDTLLLQAKNKIIMRFDKYEPEIK